MLQVQLHNPGQMLLKVNKHWTSCAIVPSRLGIQEAHEELMECLGIQLLVEGKLVFKEGSPHYATPQEAQGARLNRLVHPSHRPFCGLQCIFTALSVCPLPAVGRSKAQHGWVPDGCSRESRAICSLCIYS